jgi:hypothetical protein
MNKTTIALCIIAFLLPLDLSYAADAPAYEYRVMSIMDMFEGQPEADKVMNLAVQVKGQFNRTDMDAADYQKALNRIAAEGWELVTVNKSNYWVFRRSAKLPAKPQ